MGGNKKGAWPKTVKKGAYLKSKGKGSNYKNLILKKGRGLLLLSLRLHRFSVSSFFNFFSVTVTLMEDELEIA